MQSHTRNVKPKQRKPRFGRARIFLAVIVAAVIACLVGMPKADATAEAATDTTYTPVTWTGITVKLNLNRPWIVQDKYAIQCYFNGYASDDVTADEVDSPVPTGSTNELTVYPTEDDQQIEFGPLTLTEPGVYSYNVGELFPGDGTDIPTMANVTYDSLIYQVNIFVKDVDGKLVISEVQYQNTNTNAYIYNSTSPDETTAAGIVMNFNNVYTPDPGTATISSDAILEGAINVNGLTATTTLTGSDGAPMPTSGTTSSFDFSTGKGTVNNSTPSNQLATQSFGTITYDKAGDYTYTVTESNPSNDGVTCEQTSYTVKVSVVDDYYLGKYVATVTYPQAGADSVLFTLDYAAQTKTPLVISATKQLTGATLSGGEFTFNLLNEKGDVVATATNGAKGAISFDGLSYASAQVAKDIAAGVATKTTVDGKSAATYTYTVTEDTSKLAAGISAVRQSFPVTVTVVDEGNGTLVATAAYPSNTTLTNEYTTNAATVSLDGMQTVSSAQEGVAAPSVAGKYTYKLTAPAGTPMPETTSTNNDASGAIDFGSIKYTLSDLDGAKSKTFTYTITRSGTVEGYDTTDTVQTVTVTVTNNGDGKLTATVDNATSQGIDFKFKSVYHTHPAKVALAATTTLKDGTLKAGQFTYNVLNDKGQVIGTATNDADGKIVFSDMTYSEPGTYTYTLQEVKGDSKNIDYAGNDVKVTVTVANDPATDELVASVSYGSDAVFENVYHAPEPTQLKTDEKAKPLDTTKPTLKATTAKKGTAKLAKTGDTTDTAPVVGIVAAGAVLVAGGVVLARKRANQN
jgi:pilin isopeptide linkage protein/LPXTG-motif cell wall-anchored protein